MPELPEVETIRRGLSEACVGQRIVSVECTCERSFPGLEEARPAIVGATITGTGRRGKLLMLHLSSDMSLLVHLRMTGQLIYRAADDASKLASDAGFSALPNGKTRIVVTFESGAHLYFNDQRKFGRWQLWPTAALADEPFVAHLGPEPLSDAFTWEALAAQLPRASGRPVKAALLDQGVVAGIGNIYADESLFLAGLAPQRPVSSLGDDDVQRLWAGIRQCLSESIEAGGSSMRDYVSALGLRGDYLEQARVFGRTGEACPRCGAPIEKTRVAGRGTHWCPRCQK